MCGVHPLYTVTARYMALRVVTCRHLQTRLPRRQGGVRLRGMPLVADRYVSLRVVTCSQELLDAQVGISVLGLGDFGEQFDAAVLVCASNEGDENLQRIECVEVPPSVSICFSFCVLLLPLPRFLVLFLFLLLCVCPPSVSLCVPSLSLSGCLLGSLAPPPTSPSSLTPPHLLTCSSVVPLLTVTDGYFLLGSGSSTPGRRKT